MTFSSENLDSLRKNRKGNHPNPVLQDKIYKNIHNSFFDIINNNIYKYLFKNYNRSYNFLSDKITLDFSSKNSKKGILNYVIFSN